ncbi:MAG: transcription elongation factor GreA [Microvirga sp.]
MSRAFVRESDGSELEDLPDRPVSDHPNLVTAEGLSQIEAQIADLRRRLADAGTSGDRPEAARVSRDLRYWTRRRATARIVVDEPVVERVRFGSRVTLDRGGGRQVTYRIVGEDEADPTSGTLSYMSPLAQALMGQAIGDAVAVGPTEAEIIAIA